MIVEGSQEEIKNALRQMVKLAALPKKEVEIISYPKQFYSSLSSLTIIMDFNVPKARCQEIGNCGIHNMKELISYMMQRKDVTCCKKQELTIKGEKASDSLVNQFQLAIHHQGWEQLKNNSFISEGAFHSFEQKKLDLIPPISYEKFQLELTLNINGRPIHYILPAHDFKSKVGYIINRDLGICIKDRMTQDELMILIYPENGDGVALDSNQECQDLLRWLNATNKKKKDH